MSEIRMSDIAERLGVSTVTVSKALSGKDGVGDKLREIIRNTALEMGYSKKTRVVQPDSDTYTVGIILPERLRRPDHSFYWALCMGLIETLKGRNYYNMLEIVGAAQESECGLPDFVTRRMVDGVIVLGSMSEKYLASLEESGLPVVLSDFYNLSLKSASVIPDNFHGACEVTLHLLEMGHRRIGFVGSTSKNNNSLDRYCGYRKAMLIYGADACEDWIVENRDLSGILMTDDFALPDNIPTAFFCDTDQSAYYFVQFLQKKGYLIPNDISIASFYDHTFATLTNPGLTSYHIGVDCMADEAVRTLISHIYKKHDAPRRVIITGDVVRRASVADMRK